jgi:hypothetical protein
VSTFYIVLIRIERRTELRVIGGPPVKIMANQMDGILILSLEAKDRAPGFSGLRVIFAHISYEPNRSTSYEGGRH